MSLEQRLRNFFDDRGFRYRIGTGSLVASCINPSCGKDEHMWIRRRNGRAICFRCGSKWSWRALVSKIARVSMQDAYAVLFGEGAGDELEAPMENGLFDEREEEDSGEKTDRPILIGPDFVGIELSPRGARLPDPPWRH
jgi:hypothetical protein